MTKVYLTDAFVRSAPAVPGRIVEYRDEKERGLALRVTPTGARSWTYRYRNLAGEQRRLSLGRVDSVPLARARALVVAERAKVAERQDPVANRKREKNEARRALKLETVQQVGERYFADAAIGKHKPNAKRPKRSSTINLERT